MFSIPYCTEYRPASSRYTCSSTRRRGYGSLRAAAAHKTSSRRLPFCITSQTTVVYVTCNLSCQCKSLYRYPYAQFCLLDVPMPMLSRAWTWDLQYSLSTYCGPNVGCCGCCLGCAPCWCMYRVCGTIYIHVVLVYIHCLTMHPLRLNNVVRIYFFLPYPS